MWKECVANLPILDYETDQGTFQHFKVSRFEVSGHSELKFCQYALLFRLSVISKFTNQMISDYKITETQGAQRLRICELGHTLY